jgi:hypothetical protein
MCIVHCLSALSRMQHWSLLHQLLTIAMRMSYETVKAYHLLHKVRHAAVIVFNELRYILHSACSRARNCWRLQPNLHCTITALH